MTGRQTESADDKGHYTVQPTRAIACKAQSVEYARFCRRKTAFGAPGRGACERSQALRS